MRNMFWGWAGAAALWIVSFAVPPVSAWLNQQYGLWNWFAYGLLSLMVYPLLILVVYGVSSAGLMLAVWLSERRA